MLKGKLTWLFCTFFNSSQMWPEWNTIFWKTSEYSALSTPRAYLRCSWHSDTSKYLPFLITWGFRDESPWGPQHVRVCGRKVWTLWHPHRNSNNLSHAPIVMMLTSQISDLIWFSQTATSTLQIRKYKLREVKGFLHTMIKWQGPEGVFWFQM